MRTEPSVAAGSGNLRSDTRELVVASLAELGERSVAQIRAVAPGIRLLTKAELLVQPGLLESAEVLYTPSTDPARIVAARKLRWVQTWGAGVEWLLTPQVLARANLTVTNARGIHADPIAEHVLGLVLMFTRGLHRAHAQQLSARWDPRPPSDALATLAGKTLGLLGLGEIGRRTAQVARAFGLNVIAWRRKSETTSDVSRVYHGEQLHEFLGHCDFLVNTLPSTAETRHVIGAEQLAAMSKRPFIVNIGRGSTMDHEALLAALRRQQIAGAGLDVTEPEPLPAEHALWREPNVIITPHYAGAHPGYEESVTAIFVENLQRYLRAEPLRNRVDKEAGY